jgi:hypothetical protein
MIASKADRLDNIGSSDDLRVVVDATRVDSVPSDDELSEFGRVAVSSKFAHSESLPRRRALQTYFAEEYETDIDHVSLLLLSKPLKWRSKVGE